MQNVVRDETNAFLSIVSGTHRFRIVVPDLGDRLPVASDRHEGESPRRVRLDLQRAAAALSVQVFAPGLDYVTVLEPSPADPLSLPVRRINTLLQFTPGKTNGHRVRVQGIATLRRPNGAIFITDATGGLLVQAPQDLSVKPGDRVDVMGFPAAGDYLRRAPGRQFSKDRIPARRPCPTSSRRKRRSAETTTRNSSRWKHTSWISVANSTERS